MTEAQLLHLASRDLDLADEFLIDIIGVDGRVLWANELQLETLGLSLDVVSGIEVDALYTPNSLHTIIAMLREPAGLDLETIELELIGKSGRKAKLLARPRWIKWGGQNALRLTKMDYGPLGIKYADLAGDLALLHNIVSDATEAHWAIVFLEPVDTTQSTGEIIRQVFENKSIWRMCNKAMSKLYNLPDDIDFNSQNIRLCWPRSEVNELFVQQIIEANYSIRNALSVDRRFDGSPIYIRNDVSAEIVDGYLLKLWGNCRNITQARAVEDNSAQRMEAIIKIINAIPDPVLFLKQGGWEIGKNRAFIQLFGNTASVEEKVLTWARSGPPKTDASPALDLLDKGGTSEQYVIQRAEIPGDNNDRWDMLTLRRVGTKNLRGNGRSTRSGKT